MEKPLQKNMMDDQINHHFYPSDLKQSRQRFCCQFNKLEKV